MKDRRTFFLGTCLALFAWLALAGGVQAQPRPEPPGLVIDVQGSATVEGRGRVAILAGLAPGAELSLAPGARVVVLDSATGRQFELGGPGAFRWSAGRIEMLRPGQLAVRDSPNTFGEVRVRTGRLAQASIAMRGGEADTGIRLLSPVATWLLEPPSAFRWEPVAAAGEYRFQLTDGSGKTLHESRTRATSAALPAALVLEPGRTYGWQVDAATGGKTIEGWTEFGIATSDLRARVERARPPANAAFGDRVLYALLLEELGVREEALRLWQALAAERPSDPDLAMRARGDFPR